MALAESIKELKDAFYAQDDAKTGDLTKKALEAGADPNELLDKYLLAWTKEICGRSIYDGCRQAEGVPLVKAEDAVMLSELVMIAECLQAAVAVLKPELVKTIKKADVPGRIVIGTVEGDIHDIGKSLVASILSSAGFQVVDIGFDVPAKTFVREAKLNKADIIGLSCSLAMARLVMRDTVNELKKLGVRDNVKIITGGQAAFESDVQTYGTDAYGASISDALTESNEMMRILREERQKKKEEVKT